MPSFTTDDLTIMEVHLPKDETYRREPLLDKWQDSFTTRSQFAMSVELVWKRPAEAHQFEYPRFTVKLIAPDPQGATSEGVGDLVAFERVGNAYAGYGEASIELYRELLPDIYRPFVEQDLFNRWQALEASGVYRKAIADYREYVKIENNIARLRNTAAGGKQ